MTPNIQSVIDAAWAVKEAEVLAAQQALAEYKQLVLDTFGPLGFLEWDEGYAGTPLDLTGYVETFRDDFNTMSVTRKDGVGPWWASVHANFADSCAFLQPGDYFDPFSVINGELRIKMQKLSSTTTPPLPANTNPWKGGIIQTVNAQGAGFSQSMGYFEARMRFPTTGAGDASKVNGSWPAFWLLSVNEFTPDGLVNPGMELDVVEAYGSDPSGMHSTIHFKPKRSTQSGDYTERQTKSNYVGLKAVKDANGVLIWPTGSNMFNGSYKAYGCLIRDDFTIIYVDGKEVCRCNTLPFMHTPVYLLIDLALLPAEQSVGVTPQEMALDYVRVLAKA